MDEILVSINCTTYNHQNFIEDALKGFLMQKTNFAFEILIHDDASSDNTTSIIKEYELQYPQIIKPIYQKENKYSKGIRVLNFNSERAAGKYIAICEGDDYWIDPYKLQKQVDFMENNKNYSACCHAALVMDAKTKEKKSVIRPHKGNKVFSTEEIIEGGGELFPTNSILYRKDSFSVKPDFYLNAPIGDYPLIICLSLSGYVYYIDEFMSVYNISVENSFTDTIKNSSINKKIKYREDIEKMLIEIDLYTCGQYKEAIIKRLVDNKFKKYLIEENYEMIRSKEFSELYQELDFNKKLRIKIKRNFPQIVRYLKYHLKRLRNHEKSK